MKANAELQQLYKDVKKKYDRAFEGGIGLDSDSVGGYKLMNRSKTSFSISQEIEVAVGSLCILPQDKNR